MTPEKKIYAVVFGKVVSTLRSDLGLTQSELAERVSVGQPTISRLERGTLIPDAMLTEALAGALGLTVGQLLDYVNEGVERTKVAAKGALGDDPSASGQPWWSTPLKVAGIAGLAGLAIFAVAAALAEEEEEDSG